MTKEEYFKFAEEFVEEMLSISKKKNEDYSSGTDPFRNFKSVGDEWVEIGFYTRMSDKMSRLKSFIERGELSVENESIKDTLVDLANYACLLAGYIKSKETTLNISGGENYFDQMGEFIPTSNINKQK